MHGLNLTNPRAETTGVLEPFAGPFAARARKRIVVGLDSLGNSGGLPGLADGLRAHFYARLGDGGIGLTPLDHATAATSFAGGEFSLSAGFSNVATLDWSHASRLRAPFGRGLLCANSAVSEAESSDYLLLSGVSTTVTAVDLYFEWSKAGQSFRLRQWPTEVLSSGVEVSQSAYPQLGVVHKITFLLDVGGVQAAKGFNIESVVCRDEPVFFWAVEFHEPQDGVGGVQVIDVGTPSAKAADWSGLDDDRMRAWMRLLAPDVFVLNAGVNDRGASPQTDVAARANAAVYSHHLGRIISRLQASARTAVALVRPLDPEDAATTGIRFYDRILRSAAWAHGCAYLDERDTLGDYAAANAAGYMSTDGVHPSTIGNARRWAALADKLARFGV